MSHSSTSCYGTKSGKPLTEYLNEHDAKSGAAYVLERFGSSMFPYQCDKCGLWHLSPIDRNTSHSSTCYGKISGKTLTQYDCYYKAMCAASRVSEEHDKEMVSYKCERCQLWHLTPIERQTEHTNWSCMCKDENGQSKDCYKSKEDAQLKFSRRKWGRIFMFINVLKRTKIILIVSGT